MEFRVLVLDDDLSSISPLITDALKPFLTVDFQLSEFTLGSHTHLMLTGILPVDIDVIFMSNDFFDATTYDVIKKINSGEFKNSSFDLVLLDDHWQDEEFGGQDTLLPVVYSEIKGISEDLPIISLFTRHWNNERILRFHSIVKERFKSWRRLVPCDKNDPLQLLHVFHRAITEKALVLQTEDERAHAERVEQRARIQGADVDSILPAIYKFDNLIGGSAAMQQLYTLIRKVAPTNATVLIRGESGTGKELVANAIHKKSNRSSHPFIAVNCAALPAELIESELFGHERGSFTSATSQRAGRFKLADGGTIFLDEIGELPMKLQPKILRVLQEREFEPVGSAKTEKVDVRLVAATSRNLEVCITEGKFREDLFFRINVVPICLPPLRDRGEDLGLLAQHFLEKYCKECNKKLDFGQDILPFLMKQLWPGNVRELKNTIERIVILKEPGHGALTAADIVASSNNEFTWKTEGSSSESLLETNWVELWRTQLQSKKGVFTSNDILKVYPPSTVVPAALKEYPGTGYAGYGVLMHLAVSFGSWSKLGEYLKKNEKPRGKITIAANNIMEILGKNNDHYRVLFLFGNQGYKQVNSSNRGRFTLSFDDNFDFIIVDKNGGTIFAPKGNRLPALIPINNNIDEDTKKIIYAATQTKFGRSVAGSKEKSSKKS